MAQLRAFLKWAGSKYNCLKQIIPLLPPARRLIEPFGGSGVVFLNTNYPSYLLAETNHDLIDIFTTLQCKGETFIDFCQHYFQLENNCDEQYYKLRREFNELEQSELKSALFLYLNRHGYNGLCRYNSKGIYNVPFGLHSKPYFPRNEMGIFYQQSQKVQFLLSDFRKTFEMAEPGDVLYCDPPYVPYVENTRTFTYTQNVFSLDDQMELAELARQTAAKGIPVIISNHDTPFTRRHYEKAQINSFNVSRWINCKVDERQPVRELVAVFNP